MVARDTITMTTETSMVAQLTGTEARHCNDAASTSRITTVKKNKNMTTINMDTAPRWNKHSGAIVRDRSLSL